MQRGVLLTLLTARSFLLLLAPTGECSRAVVVVSAALVLLVKPSLCFLTVGASAALPPTILAVHSAWDLCPCLRATAAVAYCHILHKYTLL